MKQTQKPRIVSKTEFAGVGALVQLVGVVALFFGPVGIVLGVLALIIGGRMAIVRQCSECKNRVEKGVRICPACRCEFP